MSTVANWRCSMIRYLLSFKGPCDLAQTVSGWRLGGRGRGVAEGEQSSFIQCQYQKVSCTCQMTSLGFRGIFAVNRLNQLAIGLFAAVSTLAQIHAQTYTHTPAHTYTQTHTHTQNPANTYTHIHKHTERERERQVHTPS